MAGWLMAWVMILAGCNNDALSEETPDNGTGEAMTSESYINLHIVNTAAMTTRATEAATAAENAIYDGILVFFVGNGETVARLKSAVVIDQLINNPGTTASVDVVQRTPLSLHPYPTSGSGKIYVLALLNTTSTGFTVRNNMLYLNGISLSDYTRSQLQNSVINSIGSPDLHVGLYMASKPKESGQVLLQVYDPSWDMEQQCYLYDSRDAIATSTASKKKLTIPVERAAAKVKVTNSIGTNDVLTNIHLDGNTSRHPKVHTMSWAVNNFNTESYALRDGTGYTFTPVALAASGHSGVSDFGVYQQRSHQSGDAAYIAENTSTPETEVIVEVRLKDESNILLDNCYKYELWGTTIFFTDESHVIAYFKQEWTASFHNNFPHIGNKDAEEVFCSTKIVINSDNSVTVTVSNPSFTGPGEQDDLASLSTILSGTLTGYREGKMYYTYKIKTETSSDVWENKVLRNNAYNLTLLNSSITAIGRPTP